MNIGIQTSRIEAFLAFLESEKMLTAHSVQRALGAASTSGHPFDTVMTELGLIGEQELASSLCRFLDVPMLAELPQELSPQMLASVPLSYLKENAVLPLEMDDRQLIVAVADPFSSATIDALAFHWERTPSLRVLPRRMIGECIDRLERSAAEAVSLEASSAGPADFGSDDLERLKDFAREAPIVRFVADTIHRAVDAKATDIHIEPLEDHVRIRFRNDGMLSVVDTAPSAMLSGVSTRIKILSRLNIAERRLPQDGRMRIAVRGRDVDLRVSVIPSIHGEAIVLRVLDRAGVELRLEKLGFDEAAQTKIRQMSRAANGIVLVTGPTGSGKTTTLYSVLAECSRHDVKVFTVEDPVEYRMAGITQLQVNPAIDLDFATALRSILRQDPDIILLGEIRDRETAQIAIQAALTGHLVFSTLHTNSAAGALTRLRDMGVDGYLLGATIRGVIAQRLLRRVCPVCQGAGNVASCKSCNGSGYSGRTVTYEMLQVSPRIAALIDEGASELEIAKAASEADLIPMAAHAATLVERKVTTLEEVRRVIDLGGGG
ncbi:type II/IV secretion system protein [Mesorhizobium sp. M2D.F.Ca.ET.223.01.1.1]|uniref:GspE/PulE family protein n=1 Tax=Mesorhizobium sp. M2D.F.Ca.ET.223.01.1.1 TaxID=2563940 RepID=UPI001092E388|nr:GspE/PulE family protein [Mesorhizobium sp. M2D.F.Ca.ET.223.01.1.1]TGR84235.1 type II/IV secretion system protein [Mesorhizobium sp. M2D.F.Ca.ET.223.01.1.1]TGT64435.1 type II/IV secretion system protein [bacterium M00.F.Ca.ET.159.01.1.1]TGT79269.1 type II/IV secretion system protein [bacterium M00.F.Ca.ET.157.01.1.1]